MFNFGKQTWSVKTNQTDKCERKPATALSDVAIIAPLHAQTDTRMEIHYCKRASLRCTCTLSSRQQGTVSDRDRAWIRGMLRANDLRHMSSPCGFKTKHCQEHYALARQPASYFAFLRMQQAMQTSKSKMKPIIICFVLLRSLPQHTAAPISTASTDLPARLERAPQHPGDQVRSHYPQWEKLLGHGWKGKIRRTSRIRKKRCVLLHI